MPCPDGLTTGFGIGPPATGSICMIRSFFGYDPRGREIFKAGSGMLLPPSGSYRHVLTAAHNLYDHDLRRQAVWVVAYFERFGNPFLASRTGSSYSIPDEFTSAGSPVGEWDFGLLKINPLSGPKFAGIPTELSTASVATQKMIVGYPTEGDCAGTFVPYNSIFTVQPSGSSTYSYTNQPTYAGLSGAPLLAADPANGTLRSFGHHIRGGDAEPMRAIRYSSSIRSRIMSWV